MFTEEMVKKVSGYFSIVEDVQQAYQGAYAIERKSAQGEMGLFFKDQRGGSLLCLVVWYELWMRYQDPLWYGVCRDWDVRVVSRFAEHNAAGLVEYAGYRLCPVDQRLLARESCREELKVLLDAQLAVLSEAGAE
ncbi:hypothetical protein ACFL43_06625 [Thermodesulfobacteriota bacterium]